MTSKNISIAGYVTKNSERVNGPHGPAKDTYAKKFGCGGLMKEASIMISILIG